MSKRILIVDDNYDDRTLLGHIVERLLDYHFVVTKDGVGAILEAAGNQFDLVIVDLQMPQMQGWDVIKTLRQTKRYGTTPIIAVTAYDHTEARQKAFTAGCDLYLRKPVDVDDLTTAIHDFLEPAA